LPKLSKTYKKGEFFCPGCCWVKYWEIKLVKMQYFTLKMSVSFSKQQCAVSAWGIDQKLKKIPKFWSKRGQKFNIFWKIHSLK